MRYISFLKFISLTAIILVTVALSANSQKQWTLEECINYAIDNNIDIKKQLLMVKAGDADLLQSKLDLLPTLNGGGNHIYNWGQTIDRYTNTFATTQVQSNNFYLSSNFVLFSGLQKMNTMKQNQLDLMASQYDLDLLMDDISVAVAGFYLDILFNQEILEVAQEQLDVTTQQVDRMGKMVEAGSMAKGDLLNLEAQAATEELQVIESQNRLTISYLNLMQLIDYPVSQEFVIDQPQLKPIEAPSISITPDDIYRIAVDTRPEIKSAEYRVQSATKGIALAKSYISPVLTIGGNWATGYSGAASEGKDPQYSLSTTPIGVTAQTNEQVLGYSFNYGSYETIPWGTQMTDNQNKTVGLYFQVPIYNGWQVRNAISRAKIAREEADYNLQQTKLQLNKTIQQSYVDAVAALKNYNAAQKKVEAQQEAFKYAEQKFEVGIMNTVEYNDIKKNLTQAESELLQAKYRFIYTTTILDFYMGRPLKLE